MKGRLRVGSSLVVLCGAILVLVSVLGTQKVLQPMQTVIYNPTIRDTMLHNDDEVLYPGESPILQSPSSFYVESATIVSWRRIRYRLSSRWLFHSQQQYYSLVVGLLSAPHERLQRDRVRNTWAKHHPNVLFVVGGEDFAMIADEMEHHHDIVWLDSAEGYHELAYKTGAFFAIVDRLVPSYQFAMKSDAGDSYIHLTPLTEFLLQNLAAASPRHHYYLYGGQCQSGIRNSQKSAPNEQLPFHELARDEWPTYHWGEGYLLSRTATDCFRRAAAQTRFLHHEDVFVGYVMEKCRFPCSKHNASIWDWSKDWRFAEKKPSLAKVGDGKSRFIEHMSSRGSLYNLTLSEKELSQYFTQLHHQACTRNKDNPSCGNVDPSSISNKTTTMEER